MPTVGIENLKKAVKFAIDLAMQIAAIKKFKLISIFSFIDELLELGGVITSWKEIIAEFKDLDIAERQLVYDYVREEFDIPNDQVEVWVEEALGVALNILSLVERAKLLKKPVV